MSKIIRLIDRTRTVQDWKCPRSRYYGYEYLGKGIVRSGTAIELFIGIVVHDAMAAFATFTKDGQPIPIDDIASSAYQEVHDNIIQTAGNVVLPENEEYAREQASLIEGMLRGFHKHVWPRLMDEYPKIVALEHEMEYNLDPTIECNTCDGTGKYPEASECARCHGRGYEGGNFVFMAKPDLIVENKEGDLVYLEYKTTSNKKEGWVNSWETAVQLHSSIMATEQTLGVRPAYVQIVGLYKGYESYGKQSSPFCYAYKKGGNPPFSQDQIAYEYKAGFRRFPIWELPGGVKDWVERMPENILADQFPRTTPIFINEDLVNNFFKQRLIREKQIANAAWEGDYDDPVTGINAVFPQNFEQCQPGFGKPCVYKRLCHGNSNDPLQEGYVMRTPHHERETEMFNA
jgi:hypothetical protein